MPLVAKKDSQLDAATALVGTEKVRILQAGKSVTIDLTELFSQGEDGLDAYAVAVRDGDFTGTVDQWLASLQGEDGRSAYASAVAGGFQGNEQAWLASLRGADGKSAFTLAAEGGFQGNVTQWLASLVGANGKSAYQSAVDTGVFTGTETAWATAMLAAANAISGINDNITSIGQEVTNIASSVETLTEALADETAKVAELVRGETVTVRAQPGVDASAAIKAAVAKLKTAGGGFLSMPRIGGVGYHVSEAVYIDFSNCLVILEDNVTYTGTRPLPLGPYGGAAVFHFQGAIEPTVYLTNVGLVSPREVVINGGASGHLTVTKANLNVTTTANSLVCTTTSTTNLYAGMLLSGNSNFPSTTAIAEILTATTFRLTGKANQVTAGTAVSTTFSTGYDHIVGFGGRYGVMFQMCKNIEVKNIHTKNCLSGGVGTSYVKGGKMDDVAASDIYYDNGIVLYNNGEHEGLPSDLDPSTWCNLTINKARAWNCANHGLSVYGAIGVTWNDPKVWNCGNNDTGGLSQNGVARAAGPAGGIGVEFDTSTDTTAANNYRCTINNPQVTGSFGFGIRTNCKGVKVNGGFVRGTKTPTNYTDNGAAPIWGYGVFVQNNGSLETSRLSIESSSRGGLRLQGTDAQPATCVFDGTIRDCVERGIFGIGVGTLVISPTSRFLNNGTQTAGSTAVEVNNGAGYNNMGGRVVISGVFEGNGGSVAASSGVGNLELRNISGHNNGASSGYTAFHAIYVSSVGTISASQIMLTSTNSKQARILKVDASNKAIIDRSSILGDQTNAGQPRAEVVSTNFVCDIIAAVDPSAAPAYIGQKYLNTATGSTWTAVGSASADDWSPSYGGDLVLSTNLKKVQFPSLYFKATKLTGTGTLVIAVKDQLGDTIVEFSLDTVSATPVITDQYTEFAGQLKYEVVSGTGTAKIVGSISNKALV